MTLQEQIEWFFAPPDPEQSGLERSSLHQNRREIQDAFIRRALPEDQVLPLGPDARHALFATCMVIGAGIDLLSKFWKGEDGPGSGKRFKDFLKEYMFKGAPNADTLAEVIYEGVRCPMVHSFTLFQKKHKLSVASHEEALESKAVWRFKSKPAYVVSVEGLFTGFVHALNAYKAELLTSAELQARFQKMLPDYGYIRMSDQPLNLAELE
jgi:hypothetical protein